MRGKGVPVTDQEVALVAMKYKDLCREREEEFRGHTHVCEGVAQDLGIAPARVEHILRTRVKGFPGFQKPFLYKRSEQIEDEELVGYLREMHEKGNSYDPLADPKVEAKRLRRLRISLAARKQGVPKKTVLRCIGAYKEASREAGDSLTHAEVLEAAAKKVGLSAKTMQRYFAHHVVGYSSYYTKAGMPNGSHEIKDPELVEMHEGRTCLSKFRSPVRRPEPVEEPRTEPGTRFLDERVADLLEKVAAENDELRADKLKLQDQLSRTQRALEESRRSCDQEKLLRTEVEKKYEVFITRLRDTRQGRAEQDFLKKFQGRFS